MSDTIFSQIIARKIPAIFVYEDDICVVIMDKFPSVAGQSLVIPKKEIDYVFELDDEIYQHCFMIAKKIALASDKAFNTARTCLAVEGFEVPHAHIKLYPLDTNAHDLSKYLVTGEMADDGELKQAAEKIKTAL